MGGHAARQPPRRACPGGPRRADPPLPPGCEPAGRRRWRLVPGDPGQGPGRARPPRPLPPRRARPRCARQRARLRVRPRRGRGGAGLRGQPVPGAAGALVHLLLGAPGGRPSPARVGRALAAAGLGPTTVVALGQPDAPRAARFLATTPAGRELFVKFIPSERRNQDRIYRAWQALTRHGPAGAGSGSPSEQAAREGYMVLLAAAGGVRVPRVVLARGTDGGDGLLVLARIRGVPFADLDPSRLDESLLTELWRQVGLLHAARIAHHDLNRASVVVDETRQPWLVDFDAAEAFAGDRALAADVAELLVSLATIVEPEAALAGARRKLGLAALHEALATPRPPPGLTTGTRSDLHARPELWEQLRELARAPAAVSDRRARRRGTPSRR